MRKSVVINFFTLGIIFSGTALANLHIEDSVICPPLESLICINSGSNHFYNSTQGFPDGWTSNFYPNNCPKNPPKAGFALASPAEQGAVATCTYHTETGIIQIFQTNAPYYCVKYTCSSKATPTPEGGCVKFKQDPCPNE